MLASQAGPHPRRVNNQAGRRHSLRPDPAPAYPRIDDHRHGGGQEAVFTVVDSVTCGVGILMSGAGSIVGPLGLSARLACYSKLLASPLGCESWTSAPGPAMSQGSPVNWSVRQDRLLELIGPSQRLPWPGG